MANYYVNIDGTITKEKKKKKKDLVDNVVDIGKGVFNLPTTVLGTGANVASGLLKGVSDVGFETGKLAAGGVAQVADWAGQDEWANKVRNRIAGKDEETNKRLKAADVFGNINEATQDASVLGKTGNEVVKSIGQIFGYGAASAVNPVLGSIAMFGSSAGGALGEAYSKENVTNEQAWTKALVGGGISLATERLFGLFGKSGLDTAVANKISSKLTSGMSKELARLGVQATSEATEELLEYAGNQLLDLGIDAASNGKGAKFHKDWNWEEVGQQMAIAAVASGIVGAGTKAIGIRNTQGSNLQEKINNYALQEDIQEGVLPQQESPLEKLQRTNIEQRQQINQETNRRMTILDEQIKKANENAFKYEPSNNLKIDNLRKDASTYWNNTEKTNNFVKTLEKIIQDKNVEIRLDANLGNNINGTYQDGIITINPNSNRAGEFVAIHELTHAIGTDSMKNMIETYRKSNPEFNRAVSELLSKTYNTTELNEETMSDVAGQLFGNQEFINNLSMEQPSLFKRIYNEIKYLWHQFTGYKNQDQFIEDLKNKWESAYRSSNRNNNIKYSLENAKEEIGTTTDLREAGYLTTDGEYLDFSGKKQGGTPGRRTMDHREIADVYSDSEYDAAEKKYSNMGTASAIMQDFIDRGNIRLMPEQGIDISKEPTTEQYDKLYDYIDFLKERNGEVYIDLETESKNRENLEYNSKTSTKKIINDIKEHYAKQKTILKVDNQGRELSKQQQEYFKNVSKYLKDENGNILRMYHGTPNGEFTIFKPGSYFSPNQEYANGYQNENASSISYGKKTTTPKTYEVYLNITNPFTLQDAKAKKIYIEEYIKGGNSGFYDPYTSTQDYYKQFEENDIDWLEGEDLREWLKENHPEYDGLILDEGGDGGYGMAEYRWRGLSYMPFYANQIKNIDNTNPTTNDDIRYSKNNKTWKEYLEKEFKQTGTTTKLGDIKLPTKQKVSLPAKSTTEVKASSTEPKKTISKSTLTQAETKELNDLKTIDEAIGLDSEEEARMKFLEKKQQGYVERYSGLKKITDFKEISREYGKYKDLSDFNDKLLKDAEKTIQGYRNTGRRTKVEWLDIAKNIGSNYKGNSEGLTKYAIQSWFEAQPNQKDTLNRQGDKYVDFKIQEWVNAVYDGARIGELEKPLVPTAQQPKKETTSIPMAKNNESLRIESQRIANEINKNETFKQKGWLKTAANSDVLKDSGLIKDLDPSQLNYVVQSNKSSVDKANNTINTLGYEKSLDKVKQIINDDKLPSASDVALMQRMIQEAAKRGDAATVQDLIMDTAIVGTDLGQATQALSIIQRLTPEGQLKLYTKLVQRAKIRGEKSFQNVEITPEMVENVLDAYNSDGTYDQDDLNARIEQFKQDLANQMKSTVGDKANAWRYLSMLGNPKTHIRNIVSNLAMNGTIKVKNAMARTLETILPVEERTKTWKPASQDVKEFAKQTTANMKDIITGEAKYNEKSAIESKKQIFKNKALEKLSNFNGNALEAEDWFFSSRAFQSTLQEYLTANGINTYEDIQNNPEIVEKAKNYAKDQAEIATFRQYSKLAATINQIEKKNKGAKLAVQALMPFKKTPINVAKAGVKYSPLGLIKSLSYDAYQLKQGNINASQFIDNLSQGLTGTSLTLLGYALAKAGILSGSGGDDKDDKYDSQLGNTGYSLNIGGNSYSISWLSPVAMPLLVGSNAYEQLEENKDWDMNVVSDTLAKTLDPLNEMSFMQGLTNALQSYGSGVDKIKGSLESTAQNYVGQFFPTIFSQLASTLDDKKRSTKASNDSKYKFGEQTVRSIMYKIPGLRQRLEAATDIWGNEKEQSDNIIERAFESFIAPYSKTKQIETDLDKEIKRVYNETGETGVIPGVPNSYVKYKNETYRMSANEYTDYKKTYGQNANKYLNNLIDSNSYKTASDKVKAKMINNVYDYARAEANEQYFKKNNVDYTSDELKELEALREEGITGKQLANYVADKTQISSIKSDNDLNTKEKKNKILNIFENSELNNDQLSYLYSGYYSTEEKVRAINNVNIPIKEFIKYDLQDFESDYNAKNGKAVSNSKKIKTINYINNNLKLSAAQKALLIKLEYNTFKGYDNQIVNYIKSSNAPYLDKAYLLKQAGFNNFDREIINYVQSHIKTAKDKEEILKNMGFTVRNGRVYK